jgi:5'-methylthioadenosine phosphorylase
VPAWCTYLCMEGPQFSTRAESLLHRSLKADVIGMTALPEAKLAREAELPYASLCFVTDYDAWHDTEEAVHVEAVLAVLRKNVELARRILREVKQWPDPEQSPAWSALAGAVLTDPRCISQAARERLGLLVAKYFPVEVP